MGLKAIRFVWDATTAPAGEGEGLNKTDGYMGVVGPEVESPPPAAKKYFGSENLTETPGRSGPAKAAPFAKGCRPVWAPSIGETNIIHEMNSLAGFERAAQIDQSGISAQPSESRYPMFTSYPMEFVIGSALVAAAVAFGRYLYRAARCVHAPFVVRNGGAADVAIVFELGLLVIGFAYLVDGVVRALLH